MRCPTCFGFMDKIADSKEMRGIPATPKSSDFRCPKCAHTWRYDRDTTKLTLI
jgi:transposase-like protein